MAPVSWGGPGYAVRMKQTAVKKIHFHTCGAQAAPQPLRKTFKWAFCHPLTQHRLSKTLLMAMEGMLHLHNSPAYEALSAWVEATGEEVPMPAEEGSSGGVQPGVSVMGKSREGCAPAAAVAAGKAMGASAAADAELVGQAASDPAAL